MILSPEQIQYLREHTNEFLAEGVDNTMLRETLKANLDLIETVELLARELGASSMVLDRRGVEVNYSPEIFELVMWGKSKQPKMKGLLDEIDRHDELGLRAP